VLEKLEVLLLSDLSRVIMGLALLIAAATDWPLSKAPPAHLPLY